MVSVPFVFLFCSALAERTRKWNSPTKPLPETSPSTLRRNGSPSFRTVTGRSTTTTTPRPAAITTLKPANTNFYCDFNVTGEERKRLVGAISSYTMTPEKYCGAPSFAYEVGGFHIDRNGVVSFAEREQAEGLIEVLAQQGFISQVSNLACADTDETEAPDGEPVEAPATDGLTVSLPMDGFTELALDNLQKLLDAKGTLIQKALGADRLTVEISEDRVSFPWWDHMPEPEAAQAYMAFIAALSAMAKEAKRVTAKEPDAESEKYAFRCFLLRLGFIGDESKAHRKLLLQKLSGSSAFRNAEEAQKFSAAQKAKRDAAKAAAAETEPAADAEEVRVCE